MAQLDDPKFELRVEEKRSILVPAEDRLPLVFPEPLIVLAKKRAFVLKFTGTAAALAIVISLLLPTTYTAKTKLMPPQQNQSLSSSALLSQLGPLAAALGGQGLGIRNQTDVYVTMLRSDSVANGLIDRFSLANVYGQKTRIGTRQALEGSTEIIAGKDGLISISVQDRQSYWFGKDTSSQASKQRAADLANGYVDELEKLTKTLAVTEAGKRRMFFERETKMAADDLAAAELALKQTQEKTGLILLDSQSRAMIEGVASLRARISAQEIMVQSMQSYATRENPELVMAEQQLAAMRAQLGRLEHGETKGSITDLPIESVPSAGLEYVRKLRDVRYRETLFELLAKQFEAAKIDEARDAMIVQPLDRATPPELKSGPHRGLIVMSATIMAFLIAMLLALFTEAFRQAKEDPNFAARWQLFRFYFRGGNKSSI